MKIGILTVPFNNNYGGYLQCYALMSVLRKIGHEPIIINRRQNIKVYGVGKLKAFIINRLLDKKERFYNIKSMEAYHAQKGKNMCSFVERYLQPKTQPLYKTSDYEIVKSLNLDAVIVGSDQVWRPRYVPDIEEYFFKYIPENIRRMAYAASFGCDNVEYTEQELNKCSKLLNVFSAVSTREKSGQKIVQDYFGYKKAQVTLDPTMLLDKKDYCHIIGNDNVTYGKNLFAYILDRNQEKETMIARLASKLSCQVFDIMNRDKYAPLDSVEKWLKAISTSEFVITDSFHGTVFSILFNRPFYVIGNEKRGNSRILDLLSLFGLEDKLVDGNFKCDSINLDIDWNRSNEMLDVHRKQSIDFLKSNLWSSSVTTKNLRAI